MIFMRLIRALPIGLIFVSFCMPNSALANEKEVAGPKIRVMISSGQKEIVLTIKKGYRIRDFKTQKVLSDSSGLTGVNLKSRAEGLQLAGVRFPDMIEILSDQDGDIQIDQRTFRGHLIVYQTPDKHLMIVNVIDIESYLYGVLYHEVGEWWPMAALKAQAVAARTYALFQKSERQHKRYDVTNNQSSQMYGGANSERPRSNTAVDETRGEVLYFNGKVLPAFYHATCGGVTRDAGDLWNVDLLPLKGGVKCHSCWFSPHYNWAADIPQEELQTLLREKLDWNADVLGIKIEERGINHRALVLEIETSQGTKRVLAKDLRLWLGPVRVRSENFEVNVKHSKVVFSGKGWGHGVGMCQWGALGLSITRKSYEDILQFYYPESRIALWHEENE